MQTKNEEKNLLQDVEFKAVSLVKVPGSVIGNHSWSSMVLTIKNGQVIHTEMSEPSLKQVAIENAKIKFSKTFILEQNEIKEMEQKFYEQAKKAADDREQQAQDKRELRKRQKEEQSKLL